MCVRFVLMLLRSIWLNSGVLMSMMSVVMIRSMLMLVLLIVSMDLKSMVLRMCVLICVEMKRSSDVLIVSKMVRKMLMSVLDESCVWFFV